MSGSVRHFEKYKKINAEQHESVVNCTGAQDCVDKANEVSKLQADYAACTNELMEKARVNGGLSKAENPSQPAGIK